MGGDLASGAGYPRRTGGQAGIRGLLFDKDGTLFDFQRTWSGWAARLIRDLSGGDDAQAGRLAAALGFDRARERFLKTGPAVSGTLDDIVQAMLPVLPDAEPGTLRDALLHRAAGAEPMEAVPLAPLLDRLKADGLALGVATNDSASVARAQLARIGVLGRFGFVAGYDSGYGGKPGIGMHRAFCRVIGLEPGAVAAIGDSLHDLGAARRAGMRAVAVLTGPADAEDLAGAADAVLADIGELPDWLGRNGR